MPAPINHSGYEGTLVIAGEDINVQNWTASEETGSSDATTTADYDPTDQRCYSRTQPGVTKMSISADWLYDSTMDLYPSALRSGIFVLNVVLTKSSGHVLTIPEALITKIDLKQGGIGGIVSYSLSMEAQGKFTVT